MRKIHSKKVLGIPLLWVIVFTLLAATVVLAATVIISNILGPYRIHVSPESSQQLILSTSTPPPSQVYLGSTVAIDITVTNPTSSSVKGYMILNITASDFTPSTSDISLSMRSTSFGGWSGEFYFPSPTSISGGFMYKSQTQFTWASSCSDQATIYITFNKANPTNDGYYEITIGISSN